jgi:alcohol dehydrogenase
MYTHSLLLTAPRQLTWVKEELPDLRPDEVLIQTTTSAISIGTELPKFQGTSRNSQPAHYPCMTGYESAGKILSCGSAVQRFHVGERVVAFYGHRTHSIVPETKAIAVPENLSDAVALLAILSCDVTKGIRKLQPRADEAVLVTGAGTIGLLTVFMLKTFGVQTIDAIEPRPERCSLALQLGASNAGPSLPTRETRYNIGIECSSHNAAFAFLQESMATGGRICILADGNIEPLVLSPVFHEKELLVVGSSDGWDYQEHARLFFPVAQAHTDTLEHLFNYRTTADNLIATFDQLASGTIAPIKVLVQYNT